MLMIITINAVLEVRLLVSDNMEKTPFLLHLLLSIIIKALDLTNKHKKTLKCGMKRVYRSGTLGH